MAVGDSTLKALLPIAGIRIGTAPAGIKKTDRDDLTLFEINSEHAACAAVFTQNAFCAAPVQVAKSHLSQVTPKYLLINSGNANAGLGEPGLNDANRCCEALADLAGETSQQVLPFSTGVIGEPLPVKKVINALPEALGNLSDRHWESAARAIMTTDTRPKALSKSLELDRQEIRLTGIAKGAGMIQPNMATMLAFVATDAWLVPDVLQTALSAVADLSFNCISVDGDTSTNDSLVLMATGKTMDQPIASTEDPRYAVFLDGLLEVCQFLAEAIVRDGEGATKLVRINVSHAESDEEARQVGLTVANSPLVKTALFASDPNWGRILAAVGRAGISNLDVSRVSIHLGDVAIVRHGQRAEEYTEALGQVVMSMEEIEIMIDLDRGSHKASVLTCDLSYDYVRINAEYRT